jgi:geranylgeranylglycerol-phosphate geranylgeranyltransferase
MRDQIKQRIQDIPAPADPRRGQIFADGDLSQAPCMMRHVTPRWLAAIARLVRLSNNIVLSFAGIVAASTVEPPIPTTQMMLIFAVLFALTSGGHALNDFFDRDIDKINRPDRPIPAGAISQRQALIIGIAGLVAALGFSLLLTTWCVTLTLIDAALLVVYAAWSKVLGALKTIICAYLVASSFLIGAYTFDRVDLIIGVFTACGFFLMTARELIKDVEDLDGDSRYGARTVPILFGARFAYAVAFICITLSLVLAAIPYAMGLVNHIYLALVLLAAGLSVNGWRQQDSSARRYQQMIKAASVAVLVAFAVGRA